MVLVRKSEVEPELQRVPKSTGTTSQKTPLSGDEVIKGESQVLNTLARWRVEALVPHPQLPSEKRT